MRVITLLLIINLIISGNYQDPSKNYSQNIPDSNFNIEMVSIPKGDIIIQNNEISLSTFWISKFEITWGIYNLFTDQDYQFKDLEFIFEGDTIEVDGVSRPTTPYIDMSFGMGKDGYPAVNMTHFAASRFCEWLSIKTGYYYRLPTEAEWEYACRSGSVYNYSFGDNLDSLDDHAWYKNNSNEKYQKVGQKTPNKWGLYDMHGNVSEWVVDSYEPEIFKKRKKKKDPFVFNLDKYPKVYRGGSWLDESEYLKSSYRNFSDNSLQRRDPQIPKSKWWNTDAPHIGFRIVRVSRIESKELRDKFWNF